MTTKRSAPASGERKSRLLRRAPHPTSPLHTPRNDAVWTFSTIPQAGIQYSRVREPHPDIVETHLAALPLCFFLAAQVGHGVCCRVRRLVQCSCGSPQGRPLHIVRHTRLVCPRGLVYGFSQQRRLSSSAIAEPEKTPCPATAEQGDLVFTMLR